MVTQNIVLDQKVKIEQTHQKKEIIIQSGPINLLIHHWPAINVSQNKVVLCVQGLGGHGAYYQCLADEFCDKGYDVVSFDLRGHGKSLGVKGDIKNFSEYEVDLSSVYDWVKETFPTYQIHLLGESMGASIATHWLNKPNDITSVIFVSPVLQPFLSFKIQEVFKFLIWMFLNYKKPILNLRGNEEKGCRVSEFNDFLKQDKLFMEKASVRYMSKLGLYTQNALKKFDQIKNPIQLIYPECDKVTKYTSLIEKLNMFNTKKESVLIETAYHCLFHDPKTKEVYQSMNGWLKEF